MEDGKREREREIEKKGTAYVSAKAHSLSASYVR